ncbi:FAD synthetase [Artemisia annua]|uniref:FAD synthetase n=1 Tax=Artemisia annua TaxID=35608 RepID=A0A2U1NAT7_ARTAN|nr:FAD synthetase [Artemisia annua]
MNQGKNYRFGYRAAGDVTELSRLCELYDIEAYIINPVMDKNQMILDKGFTDAKESDKSHQPVFVMHFQKET